MSLDYNDKVSNVAENISKLILNLKWYVSLKYSWGIWKYLRKGPIKENNKRNLSKFVKFIVQLRQNITARYSFVEKKFSILCSFINWKIFSD